MALTNEEIEDLKSNFSSCSEETVAAIVNYRTKGDVAEIPKIVRGVVERYLPEEGRAAFREATDETPLSSLEVDSLAMLEIVMDIQDAVDFSIEDSEVREFTTLGDFRTLLEKKLQSD